MPPMEAMACGAALVTYDNGGCRDYAYDDETALVARRRDVADLAAKLERVATDETLRGRIAAAGSAFIRNTFDWGRSVRRMAASSVTRAADGRGSVLRVRRRRRRPGLGDAGSRVRGARPLHGRTLSSLRLSLSAPARARRASRCLLSRSLSATPGAVAADAAQGIEETAAGRALGAGQRPRLRGFPRGARVSSDSATRAPDASTDPMELSAVDRRGSLSRRRVWLGRIAGPAADAEIGREARRRAAVGFRTRAHSPVVGGAGRGDILTAPFAPGRFDVVGLHVLEHVPDPTRPRSLHWIPMQRCFARGSCESTCTTKMSPCLRHARGSPRSCSTRSKRPMRWLESLLVERVRRGAVRPTSAISETTSRSLRGLHLVAPL